MLLSLCLLNADWINVFYLLLKLTLCLVLLCPSFWYIVPVQYLLNMLSITFFFYHYYPWNIPSSQLGYKFLFVYVVLCRRVWDKEHQNIENIIQAWEKRSNNYGGYRPGIEQLRNTETITCNRKNKKKTLHTQRKKKIQEENKRKNGGGWRISKKTYSRKKKILKLKKDDAFLIRQKLLLNVLRHMRKIAK